jgi:signal transduction histidine kinase
MRLGLADALRRVARNVLTPRGIACQVDVSESAADLPEEHAITFYRAAQEAMTNVARHAGARQVSVAIAVEGGIARLEVVDDGRGSQTTGPDGAGLRLMRERVAGIGGRLSVEMLPTGRRVVVWAPVCRD